MGPCTRYTMHQISKRSTDLCSLAHPVTKRRHGGNLCGGRTRGGGHVSKEGERETCEDEEGGREEGRSRGEGEWGGASAEDRGGHCGECWLGDWQDLVQVCVTSPG